MAANLPVRNAVIALATALMLGCGAAPSQPNAATPAANTPSNVSAAQLLESARSGPVGARAELLLKATDLLLQQRQLDQAGQTLAEVATMQLPVEQRGRYRELLARLQLQQGKPALALGTLQDHQLMQDQDLLSVPEQTALSLLRAQALAATGDWFASAQERVFVAPLLQANQRDANQKEIWNALMHMDSNDLQNRRAKANNEQLRGWIELALIAKLNRGNPDALASQLSQWQHQWSTHPAALQLPGDFTLQRAAPPPSEFKQVALLLPLSGKLATFGDAVREGFMAAWFDARAHGANPPEVRVYDSEGSSDFMALYRRAIDEGASVVIGPLAKQHVALLYKQNLPVPTLALNRSDLPEAAPANLYQFSLAPEDEAAQIAGIAIQEHHHRALIIAPEEEAHSREMQVFIQRWQEQGGSVVATALYTNQESLSQSISAALNIGRSTARAKELERLLGRDVEFTAQRRRDVDMVFMLAKPQQARSIKPTLAYYFAGDLTVYSLSRIYNGYPSPDKDMDMDAVRFTEMPWILDDSPQKTRILADIPQSRNYLRLYAMGMDSFLLFQRLGQMAQSSGSRLYGQTGYLTLTPQLIVQRELLLAQMRDGKPEKVAQDNGSAPSSAAPIPAQTTDPVADPAQ